MSIFRWKNPISRGAAPGEHRGKTSRLKTAVSVTALGSLLAVGMSVPASAYNDVEVGPGVYITGVMSQGQTYLGSLIQPPNGDPDWLTYCINVGIFASSTKNYESVSRVSGGPKDHGQPSEHRITVAQLAAAIHNFEPGGSQLDRAALGYLTHINFEEPKSAVPPATRVASIVANTPSNVKNQAAQIVQWAKANTAVEYNNVVVVGDGEQTFTIDNIGVQSEAGGWVEGRDVVATLTGPAVFDETGTNTWTGKTKSAPFSLAGTATGSGEVEFLVKYEFVRTTLTKYHMGEEQDRISYGEVGDATDPKWVERELDFQVSTDFQPQFRSQVAAEFVAAGDDFEDTITAFVADGDEWIDGVPVTVTTSVYRLSEKPSAPSADVPADAVLVGSVDSTFTAPGDQEISVATDQAGYYVAQTVFVVADQPAEFQPYLRADFKYDFGLDNETSVAQFTPRVTTERDAKIITPDAVVTGGQGESDGGPVRPPLPPNFDAYSGAVPVVTIGDNWTLTARGMSDGFEIIVDGTLYGPFSHPLAESETVPAGAPVAATATHTFTGEGTELVEVDIPTIPGTYTWVVGIDKTKQSNPELITDSFIDNFMIEIETTIVQVPELDHYSMVREFNVHPTGQAFDQGTTDGFPADHGEFEGLGDFAADLKTARMVIYDAGADRDWANTGSEIPDDAVAVWEEEIASGNGAYEVGYDELNPATDFTPGHDYVFVYHFDGDDRVAAFHSDFNDIRQRFHVPGPQEPVENPEIGTTLTGAEGEKVLTPGEKTVLTDAVCYKGVKPNEELTLVGKLMDKITVQPIVIDGVDLESTTTFTPKESDGCDEVEFEFDSSAVAGREIVAFEYLYRDGKLIAVHADIRDEGQTVRFEEFTPKTTLTGAEGEKVLTPSENTELLDYVCPPEGVNLTVGGNYTLVLTLADQETGKELEEDGEIITGIVEFTPENPDDCGTVEVTFDSTDLAGKKVVAFEEVWLDGVLVGEHKDLDDADQTVEFEAESSGDGSGESSGGGGLAVTGASGTLWLVAAAFILAAGGAGVYAYQRRMKKNLQDI